MTLNILDIDLDFFLNSVYYGKVQNVRRLSKKVYRPWEENKVKMFLEVNCNLSTSNPTKGKYFIHHVEVFYFLRKLQEEYDFKLKFSIDHVDAHADLGLGDMSYKYIFETILHKTIKERPYPKKHNGFDGLSSGNFLAFAVACRWLIQLNYINKKKWFDDIQWFYLKDFNLRSRTIQFKKYSAEQMNYIIFENFGNIWELAKTVKPLALEPKIPFKKIDFRKFKSKKVYDYIFLTESPGFTPKKSDTLIPIIKAYMKF